MLPTSTMRMAALAAFAVLLPFGGAQASGNVAGDKLFGVDTSAVEADFADAPAAEKSALYASRMGAEIERMGVSWKWVQPKPGVQNMRWGKFDHEVDAITSYGMRPLLMIHGSPYWARPNLNCRNKHCPPDGAHLDDWATFAAAVAKRYATRDPLHPMVGIEVWNSPNTDGWWSVPGGPDPKAYASVYSWAANAVHKAVPGARVLFGSVGGNGFEDTSRDLSIPTFLQGFYDYVNRNVLQPQDGLALHAYPSQADLTADPPLSQRFMRVIQDARSVRNPRDPIGDQRKLWLTETGMTTTGAHAVNQRDQAYGILLALDRLSKMDDVDGMTLFTLVETKYNSAHPEEKGFGLLERGENKSLIPKLSYCYVALWAGQPKPSQC